jgi:hypothetical protein
MFERLMHCEEKTKCEKKNLFSQTSVILQNNNALKYKNHRCPKISCFIGEHKIKKALLDLGTSVNVIPYSVFQSLNLGELKPTFVTILLADRFVKLSRGVVKDMLIPINKFIYQVDFIVLNT